jgi:hypothetical protein
MPRHASTAYLAISHLITLSISIVLVLLLIGAQVAGARESYLANAFAGGISVFDLGTSNLVETANAGANNLSIITGPNPRLAFVSVSAYLSIVDLTIQREIRRMPEAAYSRFAAITPDGKYLLKWNETLRTLDVIDIAAFKIARRVDLAAILRNGTDSVGGRLSSSAAKPM